jgi:hypothetical protein
VGRTDKWQALTSCYGAALAGKPRLALITGEPGIGKTRLSAEFCTWATKQGSVFIPMRCYEGAANLAYEPFAGGLRSFLQEQDARARLDGSDYPWLAELSRLLPELAHAQHELDLQVAALNNLALVERDRGAIDATMRHVQNALELCQTYGDRHHEAALRNNLADLYHLSGQTAAVFIRDCMKVMCVTPEENNSIA